MNHNKLHSAVEKVSAVVTIAIAGTALNACSSEAKSSNGVYCAGGDVMTASKGDTLEGMIKRNAVDKIDNQQAHLAALKRAQENLDATIGGKTPQSYNFSITPTERISASNFSVSDLAVTAGEDYIIPKCQLSDNVTRK